MTNEQERIRIGQRVAELRKAKKLTQEELSVKAGLQRTHVVRIEQGKYNVGIDTLAAVGEVLGYAVDFVRKK